jgi:hypothetical protein
MSRTRSGVPFDKEYGDAFGRYYFSFRKMHAAGVRKFVMIQLRGEHYCDRPALIGTAGPLRVLECVLPRA